MNTDGPGLALVRLYSGSFKGLLRLYSCSFKGLLRLNRCVNTDPEDQAWWTSDMTVRDSGSSLRPHALVA